MMAEVAVEGQRSMKGVKVCVVPVPVSILTCSYPYLSVVILRHGSNSPGYGAGGAMAGVSAAASAPLRAPSQSSYASSIGALLPKSHDSYTRRAGSSVLLSLKPFADTSARRVARVFVVSQRKHLSGMAISFIDKLFRRAVPTVLCCTGNLPQSIRCLRGWLLILCCLTEAMVAP